MQIRLFFRFVVTGWVALLSLSWQVAAAAPSKIVSLNLCADQYLVALADPEQIVSLTYLSRDPSLSYFAEQAKNFPAIRMTTEKILQSGADLIFLSPFHRADVRAMIDQFHLPVFELETNHKFNDILQQTLKIADAIGQPERGSQLVAQMREQMMAVSKPSKARRATALHYQRRGYLSGSETLMSEIMEHAGLINAADRAGTTQVGRISLEVLLRVQPDYILTDVPAGVREDIGTELLEHPALTKYYDSSRRIYLPRALTLCGGPSFSEAVSYLHQSLGARSTDQDDK